MRTISAGDANRHFSSLLRDVAGGETVTILSRGQPVARMLPAHPDDDRAAARLRLLDRLHRQKPTGVTRDWNRDELYES